MNLPKTNYLSYEPMVATVTVYNRAGNDVVLGGPKGRGWMSFDVYRDGQLLSPRSFDGGFETMLLKAGRSVTKKVDINRLYPVADYGSYTINASVYFPPRRSYFSSKKRRVNVTDARAFWKQSFGFSQGRNKLASFRQFSLHEHRESANSALYVYVGQHESGATASAQFVLPATTAAESEGTFTNYEGRVQRFWRALDPPGMARPPWLVLGALAAELGCGEAVRSAEDSFGAMGVDAFAGITYADIGERGTVINEIVHMTGV